MTDIVERLRTVDISWSQEGEWCAEAADEIIKLRGSLQFIAMMTPLNGQSWESHAKFITAYALDVSKEKTLYDEGPRRDDRGDNLDGN